MNCPGCGKALIADFSSCAYCGAEHLSDGEGIRLVQLFGAVETGKRIHAYAQERIHTIGRNLGFESTLEYECWNLVKPGRRSFIDVVWGLGSKLVAGFEVKPKKTNVGILTTRKDVLKLQKLVALEKFVVNVSELTGRANFFRITAATVARPKSSYLTEARIRYPRAFEAWTSEEDRTLQDEYERGLPLLWLAETHQRKPTAIQARLVKLGSILPDSHDENGNAV